MNPFKNPLQGVVIALAVAASACIAQSGEDPQSSQTEQLSAQSAFGGGSGGQKAVTVGNKQWTTPIVQPSLGPGVTQQQVVEDQVLLQTNTGDPSNGDTSSSGDGNDPTPVPWAPVTRSDITSKSH